MIPEVEVSMDNATWHKLKSTDSGIPWYTYIRAANEEMTQIAVDLAIKHNLKLVSNKFPGKVYIPVLQEWLKSVRKYY